MTNKQNFTETGLARLAISPIAPKTVSLFSKNRIHRVLIVPLRQKGNPRRQYRVASPEAVGLGVFDKIQL